MSQIGAENEINIPGSVSSLIYFLPPFATVQLVEFEGHVWYRVILVPAVFCYVECLFHMSV